MEKFKQVKHTLSTFQSMVEHVLYYPEDKSFPLVDMYYKIGSELVGKEHARNVSV